MWLAAAFAALVLFVIVGAAVYRISKRKHAPPAVRSLTRITFDEGLQADPTWSPDGRFIAHSAEHAGATNVWMQQIGAGDPVQVTAGPGPNWQPNWSPDGKYIVYRSDVGEGGVYIVPAIGGAGLERRVSTFGCCPSWSPDGSQILFQNVPRTAKVNSTFHVVRLDGSLPRRVLADFFRDHRHLSPISAAWHPDGRRVTVWTEDDSQFEPTPDFWTMPLDGGRAENSEITSQIREKFTDLGLPGGGERVDDAKFIWSPAGDALYLERTFRGVRSLWRMNIDATTLKATGVERLTTGGGFDTGPALAPDGKKLAFTAASSTIQAWVYPLDANHGRITGVGRPLTSPGLEAWETMLSNDGTKLAFWGVRGGEARLWVKYLPEGQEAPLFTDAYSRYYPQWSPDGSLLVYGRDLGPSPPNSHTAQLMMWSAQTGEEKPLTSPLPALKAVYDWSPDGTSVLTTEGFSGRPRQQKELVRETGKVAVWRVPLSGAPTAELHEREIISDPAYELYQAHDSPDGQWIVFEAVKGSRDGPIGGQLSALYVVRSSGGPWKPIVNDEHWADKPRWSPDGKIIYFLWGRGSFFNVWGIHFDPKSGKALGEPFRMTSLDSPNLIIPGQLGRLEISLTRKDLVVTHVQVSGGIWILDNVDIK